MLPKTTATVYRHSVIYSLVFRRAGEGFSFLFLCLCPLSNCALSGCGGNTEQPASKQNPNMCSLSVCFSLAISHSFSSPALLYFPLLLFSSSHRTPSLCLSVSPPSPSLSLWPSSSSACLGKADCGIPGKPLRERLAERGVGGGGEHLTQHIYSTVDILVAYFERRRLPLYYIFLTVDRKSPTSSPGCSHTSLWHGPSSESFAPPRRQFLSLIQVEFQLERQHQPTLLCLLSRHNSYSFKLVSLRASPEGPASGTGTTALGNV